MVTEGGWFPHLQGGDIRKPLLSKRTNTLEKPLTTVIGLKYNSGVLLYSDTQETLRESNYDSRNPYQTKLYQIGDNYAIGCAGKSADIDRLVNELKLQFDSSRLYSDEELFSELNSILVSFYETLKRESKRMYDKPDRIEFDFIGLFAAPLKFERPPTYNNEKFGLYRIVIESDIAEKPYIAKVAFYDCIGSGKNVSRALLNLIEGLVQGKQSRYFKLSRELCAMICHVVIALTQKIDIESGGTINAMYVSKQEAKPLSQEKYWDRQTNPVIQTIERFSNEVGLDPNDILQFFRARR